MTCGADFVNIDSVGVGSGVYDRCKEMKLNGVADINVGESSKDPDKYANLRAEVYMGLRKRFEQGDIMIPPDTKLVGQLSTIKIKYTSRGQVLIESKEKMREQGLKSPDRADALCLSFIPGTPVPKVKITAAHPYKNFRKAYPGARL